MKLRYLRSLFLTVILAVSQLNLHAQKLALSTIATNGWANNSVNAVVFRKNSLVTFNSQQYAAYYDQDQYVVLAKRKYGSSTWQVNRTGYKGDARDAHKTISIMVDGGGYLHIAWGQHNNPLNYARSVAPESLTLSAKLSMTGNKEEKLSYPEFYKLADGNLLFFYRDGGSGNGNLIINHYDYKLKQWSRLQDDLIDGEGKRNAYWQVFIDVSGTIHLSWVWRETPDVASNHDMAYACSKDGGKTWQTSTGKKYSLPITATNAEYALKIPQSSELINQTSMFADAQGHPFIATYYKDAGQATPQYHIIFKIDSKWQVNSLNILHTPFSLRGIGTKNIPISRPQIVAWKNGKVIAAALIFRAEEMGDKISVAINNDINDDKWQVKTLLNTSVGEWEPTFDTELWKSNNIIDLFIQKVTQVDGEGNATEKPQTVQVLEWNPKSLK